MNSSRRIFIGDRDLRIPAYVVLLLWKGSVSTRLHSFHVFVSHRNFPFCFWGRPVIQWDLVDLTVGRPVRWLQPFSASVLGYYLKGTIEVSAFKFMQVAWLLLIYKGQLVQLSTEPKMLPSLNHLIFRVFLSLVRGEKYEERNKMMIKLYLFIFLCNNYFLSSQYMWESFCMVDLWGPTIRLVSETGKRSSHPSVWV